MQILICIVNCSITRVGQAGYCDFCEHFSVNSANTPRGMIKEVGSRPVIVQKMKQVLWSSAVLVVLLAVFTETECRSMTKREANPSIDPHSAHNRYPKSVGYRFAWDKPSTTPKGPTTTEDIVMFTPGQPVSLDIPPEVFGSSFTLVTNLSNTIGDYMVNSAVRLQRLLESMRPFIRFVFGAKGFVIEGPTDKPIFSDPNEVKEDS